MGVAQKEGAKAPEKGKRRSGRAGRLIRGRFLEPLKSRNARRHRALGSQKGWEGERRAKVAAVVAAGGN